MPETHRPRFRIHRFDSPSAPHYQAFWQVEGNTFRVEVWDQEAWQRMPESEHPPDARRLVGPGWMRFRPLAPSCVQSKVKPAR